MITAKVLKDHKGIIQGFSVQGHALFDRKGKDIVCSAVSILTINTVNALEKFTKARFSLEQVDGISLFFKDDPDEKAQLLINTYLLGLQGIEKEYGDYFRLSVEEVWKC